MNLKKGMRIALWAMFGIYCFALVFILFLNARNDRDQGQSLWDYMKFSVNLIPFKTIVSYVGYLYENKVDFFTVFKNIFGNFFLFFPMGIFLPCLFQTMQKLRKTALAAFGMIFFVEFLQLFLRRGIFDIDDFILNMIGCVLGYALIQIRVINRLLKKFYLMKSKGDSLWRSD